ncbi:hypothetical protein ZWY2020_009347 [Hordeum vulgare]|nr:hypothetical protein ZWY2020_009347 [Hordeum vulgare]
MLPRCFLSGIKENRATIGVWRSSYRFAAALWAPHGKEGRAHHALPSSPGAEQRTSLSLEPSCLRAPHRRSDRTSEKAMVVLASLASIADGRDAVVEAGGIPALVETIEDGPAREKEFAVVALLQLCSECSKESALRREGATGCLRSFSLNFASDSSNDDGKVEELKKENIVTYVMLDAAQLQCMSYRELQDLAKARGLASNGIKKDVIEGLLLTPANSAAVADGGFQDKKKLAKGGVGEVEEEVKKEKIVKVTKKGVAVLDEHIPDDIKMTYHYA